MKPTTDEVLKWAREVGLTGLVEGGLFGHFEQLYSLAYAAGAAAMKERAAKVCDELAELNRVAATDSMWQWGECAAAIRALGDDDE